ncbi:MAG: hypothetical protein D8M26_00800 [Ignavibacteriae bacterium]|nr:hypothetical protein [Ignavibacteriota bacterium]
MVTEKETDIKAYVAGFHLRKPDFNFKAISGEMFNNVRDILNIDFDVIQLDENVYILKALKDNKGFAFNYEFDRIIYQDANLPYEKFESNAFKLLELWQRINKNATYLRLAGIIFNVDVKIDKPLGTYHSRIYDNYFKDLGIKEKKKQVDFHINYIIEKSGRDFNINMNFIELLEKKYSFNIRLDINEIDVDGTKKIDFIRTKQIFEFAKNYYDQEILKFIKVE